MFGIIKFIHLRSTIYCYEVIYYPVYAAAARSANVAVLFCTIFTFNNLLFILLSWHIYSKN